MSDLLAQKKAKLEELKRKAIENRNRKNKGLAKSTLGTKGQAGKSEDINELMDKVISSSAFEERKMKEEEENEDAPVEKPIDASLSVALDQCEHSISPALKNFLDQEIQ
jgi:sugar-specific transcriptional regulator TrmB